MKTKYPKPTEFAPHGSDKWKKQFTEALQHPNFIYKKPKELEMPNREDYRLKSEYENEVKARMFIMSLPD